LDEEEKKSERRSEVETSGLAHGMLKDVPIEMEDNITNREEAESEIQGEQDSGDLEGQHGIEDLEANLPKGESKSD